MPSSTKIEPSEIIESNMAPVIENKNLGKFIVVFASSVVNNLYFYLFLQFSLVYPLQTVNQSATAHVSLLLIYRQHRESCQRQDGNRASHGSAFAPGGGPASSRRGERRPSAMP